MEFLFAILVIACLIGKCWNVEFEGDFTHRRLRRACPPCPPTPCSCHDKKSPDPDNRVVGGVLGFFMALGGGWILLSLERVIHNETATGWQQFWNVIGWILFVVGGMGFFLAVFGEEQKKR